MTHPEATADSRKRLRDSLVASVALLLGLALLALLGAYALERSRPVAPADAIPPPADALPARDPQLAARSAAEPVAFAIDLQRPTPAVPSCQQAIRDPTDARCAAYDDALTDFLRHARRPCNTPGYVRAEDLSCVRRGTYFERLFA